MAAIEGQNDVQHVKAIYEKSKLFRVAHCDGVIGGFTPHGNVHIAFYNERPAIPRQVEFDVINNVPQAEKVTEGKEALIREIEIDVMMNVPLAISVCIWLRNQLDAMSLQTGISVEDWRRSFPLTSR